MNEQRVRAGGDMESEAKFLTTILQLLKNNRGSLQQISLVLEKQQAQLPSTLLTVLPQVAAQLYAQRGGQRTSVAFALYNFGNLITKLPSGMNWLNLELAIESYRLALQVYTHDAFPENWIRTQINLAGIYVDRIRGNQAENSEQAISIYEEVLQVLSCDTFPSLWALTQHNLACIYHNRIQGDRADNLERTIAGYKLSLQIYINDALSESCARAYHNLAAAYCDRRQGDRAENLEQAIAAYEQAQKIYAVQIHVSDEFRNGWALTQYSLAVAYEKRIIGDRAKNLERMINACKQSLLIYTRDTFPVEWARSKRLLGNAYHSRLQGVRAENIEQAIIAYEQSLQVFIHDLFPLEWARTQFSLANAYHSRIRGEKGENLEQAIAACEKALQVYIRDAFPKDWASLQGCLAALYRDRLQGERAVNLEQVITACQQALQIYTCDAFPQDWATTQNNLAFAYSNRIRGDRADNIEQEITALQLALQVYTRDAFPQYWAMVQYNLANAYSDRIRGDRADNLEQAITAYQLALQVRTLNAFPRDCRTTARNLGNLYFVQQSWSNAAEAYNTALIASEDLYQACLFLDGKAAELTKTADLPRRTAYTLAHIGNLQKAVEVLEQSRARGLRESLDRDRVNLDQLQQLAPVLHDRYQCLTTQLCNLENQQRDLMTSSDRNNLTPEDIRATAIALRQQLNTLIQDIRQVPSYEAFLTLPTFEDVRQAVSRDRPLVYLVSTSAGSLALVVTPDNIESIWLNNFTRTQLIDLLDNTWLKAYSQSQTDHQTWLDAIDATTRQLWQLLMEPLIRHLKTRNFHQATLIPGGYLGFLPLHAAWTEDPNTPTGRHYALDDIHFTYAPNAKSLTAAQEIATRTPADSILAINNPRKDLPNSEQEVQAAIAYFPSHQVLRHGEATIAPVRDALKCCNVLHLSCHGTAALREPLTSGLLMSDGLLTLKDLLDLKLAESNKGGIRLAILSACETGLAGIENADEVIGLPTGLLQAGVAGVIASLWAVDDLSTRLLLVKFYELWREKKLPPDQALRQAQIWLRDSTDGEKEDFFPDFIALDRSARSFTHPYHWAAFSYTGV